MRWRLDWLISFLLVASTVAAEDLWVSPTHFDHPTAKFAWPLTGRAFALFGFAVPDDMMSFRSAHVVLLPATNHTGTFGVAVEVKRDGEAVDAADVDFQQNQPISLTKDQITGVDISFVFSGRFDSSSAGKDYVSVFFWVPKDLANAHILGLRFDYTSSSGRLAVFDNNDVLVGEVHGFEGVAGFNQLGPVVLLESDGFILPFLVTTTMLRTDNESRWLLYESADCSGQGYVLTSQATSPPMRLRTPFKGADSLIYVLDPGGVEEDFHASSRYISPGPCEQVSLNLTGFPAIPLSLTLDAFVPPFRVE